MKKQLLYCAVSVATVWTDRSSPRDIDQNAVSYPVKLNEWLSGLSKNKRLDLVQSNRIETQLLYGEPVLVEEVKEDWTKIIAIRQPSRKHPQGYPGWVPTCQLRQNGTMRMDDRILRVKNAKAQLWTLDNKPHLVVSFNTLLPVHEVENDTYIIHSVDGFLRIQATDVEWYPSLNEREKKPMAEGIHVAEQFLDTPYLWGGMSSYGFDCSGFTYQIAKACGHHLSRDARDQALEGQAVCVTNVDEWRSGDLLFFAKDVERKKVTHVGIYCGDGLMLHAPSTGEAVEYLTLKGSTREQELCLVRRID